MSLLIKNLGINLKMTRGQIGSVFLKKSSFCYATEAAKLTSEPDKLTSMSPAKSQEGFGVTNFRISGKEFYSKKEAVSEIPAELSIKELIKSDPVLQNPDYFQVHQLFTLKDLFDARVHLGHKVGSMNPRMSDFIYGNRFDTLIIDLDKTAFHLRQALNFVAHIAYRKGIIMFVSRYPNTMHLVEKTAIECGEYAQCREWHTHLLTNSARTFGGITRLPDAIIMLNTLNTILAPHGAINDAAKMLIPTVGIVDTNCDPNLITYPIPGNDDSLSSIQLYCKLFKEAILRGKSKRKQTESANV